MLMFTFPEPGFESLLALKSGLMNEYIATDDCMEAGGRVTQEAKAEDTENICKNEAG